ncbi:MAG: branched-chain amino acid ABC transporter permease, partial [Pusillimonas sp.]
RNDPFIGTVLTVAISILLVGVMAVVWGSAVEQLPLPNQTVLFAGQSFSLIGLGTILVGSVLAVIVLGFFYKTNIGIELQALANNRKLAVLAGIPVRSRMLGVWVGASVISGIAGVLLAAVASVSVEGAVVGFSGMVAAIIGGLTSPAGALVGALILALGETVVGLSFDIRYSIAVPVGLLVVLLAVRPWGLSARVEQITRT